MYCLILLFFRQPFILPQEPVFDALHDFRQGRLGHLIIDSPSVFPPGEQPTMLHHPQMLRGHVARQIASLGELPDRKLVSQHQLDHAKPNRMGQRPQTLGRLLKMFEIDQRRIIHGVHTVIIS
jgi:hypothetical protein